jgi:prepilin-type processing-associated H-X9-DG protein
MRTANSAHPNGVNLLKCDGSVTFVPKTVDMLVWRAYGSRSGGEAFND